MRGVALITLVLALTSANGAERRELRHRLVGKQALVRTTAGAAFEQLRNSPREWGRGPAGFAKRVASGFGQHVVKETIQFGVATWHHEDLHYHPSNLQGKWPRLGYALKSTVWVPRTNRSGKTVALGRISGNLGAGMISRAWQPASTAGLGAGLASGGVGLGASAAANVAREFWPRHSKSAKAVHGGEQTRLARRR